ncbi:hypothetical protein GALL_455220 [mine drainage metagenome]|uniref:Uncharacterized protein n=1 Tax=mine drainage metagenome TaxID=410659 RepID=A0A1J5PYF6_9ZZZZ
MACQQLSRSNGLHRFAQAHFITNQAAPGARSKQGTFDLVRVELDFEQLGQCLVVNAFGVGFGQHRLAMAGIALLGDELPHIVIATQVMAQLLRSLQQGRQAGVCALAQGPV